MEFGSKLAGMRFFSWQTIQHLSHTFSAGVLFQNQLMGQVPGIQLGRFVLGGMAQVGRAFKIRRLVRCGFVKHGLRFRFASWRCNFGVHITNKVFVFCRKRQGQIKLRSICPTTRRYV